MRDKRVDGRGVVSADSDGERVRNAETVTGATAGGGAGGELAIGASIGKYEVRRVVGAGGAGVVLAAYDAELGRSVAIKFLVRESEEARTRLMREAKAMAQLHHPNVVAVYEVVRIQERIGLVMALVEGRDLGAWAASKRTWREIVAAYAQAGRGLAAAHRAGLVHRDFKPANALVDDDGVVRVTDFGLVRTTDHDVEVGAGDGPTVDRELTRTGTIVGTPAYMAPEQHAGGVVDARTDQWALACSLYGALYEQRPFTGQTLDELRASVLAGELREEPESPVPSAIRAAIRRALANDPAQRFPTMDAFVHALTPRRRAWVAVAIAAGVGALGAGAIAFALAGDAAETCDGLDAPMRSAWNPIRAAVLRGRFSAAGTANGDRTVAALDDYSKRWGEARVRVCEATRRGESSPELLDRTMSCLDQRRAEVDALAGALVVADRGVLGKASSAVGSLHPLGDCDDPRDTVPRPSNPAVRAEIARGEDAFARAWAMGTLNQFLEAKPTALAAVQIAERAGWAPLVARSQLQLGRSLSHEANGAGAVAAFDRAAAAAASARDDTTFAEALIAKSFSLGSAEGLGRPDDALAMKPYVELAIERAGRPPRLRSQWLHHLAALLYYKHQPDDALAAETESYNIIRALVPPDRAALADSLSLLSTLESERHHLDRAQELLNQTLAIDIELNGENHETVAEDYNNRGELKVRRKDLLGALDDYQRAERMKTVANWMTPVNIARTDKDLGRWQDAGVWVENALAIAEQQAPGDSVPVALSALAFAQLLIDRGELERAGPMVERALAALRAVGSPYLREGLGTQAMFLLAAGKPGEAREAIRAARAANGDPSPSLELAEADLARRAANWPRARTGYARAIEIASEQPGDAWITAAIVGIAEVDMAQGKPAAAVRALDERLAWQKAMHADPAAMVRTERALARARVASGRAN